MDNFPPIENGPLDEIVSRNFRYIEQPGGSTNPEHICLHKMYVNWRALNIKDGKLGSLKFIGSEMQVITTIPNDSYIKFVDGNFKFQPNKVYNNEGLWQADSIEFWRENEQTFTRTVEVLPCHAYLIFVPNSRDGNNLIEDIRDSLFNEKFITKRYYDNITNQIKNTKFGKGDESGFKKFAFENASEKSPRTVRHNAFSKYVNPLSELERKIFLWNNSSDDFIFVVFDEDAEAFEADIINFYQKDKIACKIGLATIDYKRFASIMGSNGGQDFVRKKNSPLFWGSSYNDVFKIRYAKDIINSGQ